MGQTGNGSGLLRVFNRGRMVISGIDQPELVLEFFFALHFPEKAALKSPPHEVDLPLIMEIQEQAVLNRSACGFGIADMNQKLFHQLIFDVYSCSAR